jgi:hypothetical protein
MMNLKDQFEAQRISLENFQPRSSQEKDSVSKALRLNREGQDFAAQGRELEAHIEDRIRTWPKAGSNGQSDA